VFRTDLYRKWRYRLIPDHVLGEILSKRWIDNAIPFSVLTVLVVSLYFGLPGFFGAYAVGEYSRQFAELGLVTLAMTIVMLGGGIDLSVGSIFAIANFVALYSVHVLSLDPLVALVVTLAAGIGCGALNGVLIGYFKMRAFLTTLVTLIIFRAVVDMLLLRYSLEISSVFPDSELWAQIGDGALFDAVPYTFLIAATIFVVAHVVISRMRPGWHLMAVGGSRRSAYNAGIKVRRTVFFTYVASGGLSAMAAYMYAARLASTGAETGKGMELVVLTAAILGGTSLGGGRGSVAKAVFGALIVLLLSNALVQFGIQGGATALIFGLILLASVIIEVRWSKNRGKILNKVYVSPTYARLPDSPPTEADSGSPYAVNDKLRRVDVIGLGQIEGPEDVILDSDGNLYCGTRHGDIIRFFGPDHTRHEVFAHTGGHPLGMAFDRDGNLVSCVSGMGVYKVDPAGNVSKVTDQTNRSWTSIIDDSRLSLADDLDIAPDGRIFFSEATKRFDLETWPVDVIESRGNGRIVCWHPDSGKTRTVLPRLRFPNGICIALDGQSLFFAETWACRISRYWFDGPKAGRVEILIDNLPGYPDNINRASDGNYWLALVGMRGPAIDLALQMPDFRKRMSQRVASSNWLFPNINTGCVVKFNEQGEILDALWDLGGVNHPMVTSMREHQGYLYLGGIYNNRIGKYKIPGADPDWQGVATYWGPDWRAGK